MLLIMHFHLNSLKNHTELFGIKQSILFYYFNSFLQLLSTRAKQFSPNNEAELTIIVI